MKKQHRPPRWADKFLEWYCRPELLEEIQGDIYEIFHESVKNNKVSSAKRNFIWNVFRSFRLSTIRQLKLFSTIMLKNNFKIAFRQIAKQKTFSAIKIGGFALGIAACILIALFVKDELSYDKHYPDGDQLYRLYVNANMDGELLNETHFQPPMANALVDDFPEVIVSGRINASALFDGPGSNELRRADSQQNTYEEGFAYADQAILDIFQFPFIYGDRESALSQNGSIVISEEKARKYFPDVNPIGQIFYLNDNEEVPFKVTGVIADTDQKSHLPYDFYLSLSGKEFWPGEQTSWEK